MSNINKKRRKRSFLNKISDVFKRKNNELGQQSEFCGQVEVSDDRQSDNSKSNSDNKIVVQSVSKGETCITTAQDSSSETGEYNGKNIADVCTQQSCKNVIAIKNDESFERVIENNERPEREKYYVMKNEQEKRKLGTDRHINVKIAFLNEDNDSRSTSQSYLKSADNETKDPDSDMKSTESQHSCFNNAIVTNDTRAFIVKETKVIFQENSEDSDFSADSTEDSFEESSEDENEHLIESEKTQKYLKDEYFTKGKYITYFFLEMERQFYNPSEVYKMVQYNDTTCEKPEKEGIKKNNT